MTRFWRRNKKGIIITAITLGTIGAAMSTPFVRRRVLRSFGWLASKLL
jgi:hypothetical protein